MSTQHIISDTTKEIGKRMIECLTLLALNSCLRFVGFAFPLLEFSPSGQPFLMLLGMLGGGKPEFPERLAAFFGS